MTIEEIRKNAPEGSTHYNPSGIKAIYYKVRNGSVLFWVEKHKRWYGSIFTIDNHELKPL